MADQETMAGPEDEVREIDATPVMGVGTLGSIVRAEVDMQITTAKRYPRSLSRFKNEVRTMACLDQETAESCMYTLKRDGKSITGPSARMAEIVLSAWGNARGGARIVDDSGDFVTAQGFMHDLEQNVAVSFEVRRRITTREGKRYSADMIGVTANAAASIAFRNAVLKVVPKAYWGPAFESARATVRGEAKTLVQRRAAALDAVSKLGVSTDRLLATLGVTGIEDIGLDELVSLKGILNAIEEGDTTVDQAFVSARPNGGPAAPASSSATGMAGLKAAVGTDTPTASPAPEAPVVSPPPPAPNPATPPAAGTSSPVSAPASPQPAPARDPHPTCTRLGISIELQDLAFSAAARTAAGKLVGESQEITNFHARMAEVERLVTAAKSERAAHRKAEAAS